MGSVGDYWKESRKARRKQARRSYYHDPACIADRRFPRWSEPNCTCVGKQHTNDQKEADRG